MTYATIDDLRSQLGAPKTSAQSAAYAAKMLHTFPDGAIVDRNAFVLDRCRRKHVLEFGASGPLHEAIKQVAATYLGVDRQDGDRVVGFNLDDVTRTDLPQCEADVVICGEVLEHLSNPGHFLARLRAQYSGVPVVITVPNAFTAVGQKHLQRGVENVNIDHVAWYSPRTLRTLLERVGYHITQFAYYNGDGPSAEGLIAVVE